MLHFRNFAGRRTTTQFLLSKTIRYMSNNNKNNIMEEENTKNCTIIAIAQMRSTNDKLANLQQVKECIKQAKDKKALMLFLPECCDFVGENAKETLELSEPLNGDLMKEYCKLANEYNLWLSLGGIHESILNEQQCKTDKIYNAHVLIDNDGKVVSIYRKLHLFDVDTPEFRFRESTVVKPGPELKAPIQTPIGLLGLQICYDVRFSEASLLLRKAGADFLTYPSAFAFNTGQAHWEILLRARAIETQCFVIAAAQTGWHNSKRRSWGHAMIINPWGTILANCNEEELNVATAIIDLTKLQHTRQIMPCFQHRRAELYALTSYNLGIFEATENRCFADNIIDKRTIFYESKHSYAFTNLRCVVEGHVLVSTKRLTPRLNGLNCEEMTDLFATVCKLQRMLEHYYKTTSATVTVQDGTQAGQTVPHVHFHIMPRREGDFKENDQIYVKLEDITREQPPRTMDQRINEAQIYRNFLKQNYTQY